MEKEQAFRDAAFNYKLAWKYGNQFSPTVGRLIITLRDSLCQNKSGNHR